MKSNTTKRTSILKPGRQDLRKVIHISIGMIGFAYPFLEWEPILFIWLIATFCAWFLPSKIESLERILRQDEIKRGYSSAMIAYGVIMVVGTIIFRSAYLNSLILLAVLAFGDGFSSLIGMNSRGTPLFYNPQKTIVGSFAFIIFGTVGALCLVFFHGVFTISSPILLSIGLLPIFRVLIIMTVCAIVESIPWKFTDNIPVGIAAILMILVTSGIFH
jgi:dolichol kinase